MPAHPYPWPLPKYSDLSPYEQREYARLRAEGTGAQQALLIAGKDHGGPPVADEDGETFERDGFLLTVRIKVDEYCTPEEMGLGKYTSTWEEGRTLDRKREGYPIGRDQHPYFLPDYTYEQHRKDGSTHDEALSYVRADLKRAEGYADDWYYITIRVTAERCGVELGSASVGGIEDDCGKRYIRDIIDEQADEAIAEAQEALKALCESVTS